MHTQLYLKNRVQLLLPPAVLVDIKQLQFPRIVRQLDFDAATFFVAFQKLQWLDCVDTGNASSSGWVPYDFAKEIVQAIIEGRPVNNFYRCDRDLVTWCDSNRLAVLFFHRFNPVSIISEIRSLRSFWPCAAVWSHIAVNFSISRDPLASSSLSVETLRVVLAANIGRGGQYQVDYVSDFGVAPNCTSLTISFLPVANVTPRSGPTVEQLLAIKTRDEADFSSAFGWSACFDWATKSTSTLA